MTDDLRTSLHRIADGTAPLPVADDLWQRGRAARRRGQALAVAAALAIVVGLGGIATLTVDDREVRTASTEEVPGGAIPSRIVDPGDLRTESDLAVGRASVAFAGSGGQAVVVTATDGRYHALGLAGWDGELLSLSPDGTSLVWTVVADAEDGRPVDGLAILDLVSGETSQRPLANPDGTLLTPQGVSWSPSGQWLTWFGGDAVGRMPVGAGSVETSATGKQVEWSAVDDEGVVTLDANGPRQWMREGTVGRMTMSEDTAFDGGRRGRNDAATASPTGGTFALASSADAAAVDFLAAGRFEERSLATDLYPDGAAVRPLGWASDTLVLARVDGPGGSYVEGPHVALFTAPNAPEQQWTYRVVLRDVPDTDTLTIAVDLIPDLDGTSSQQLTHDFPVPEERDISWLIGLGVAAAIAVLMALRWLWRRLTS